MRINSGNPNRNQLPAGIDETELIKAIESSGYPLQGIVASKLKDYFGVTKNGDILTVKLNHIAVLMYSPIDHSSKIQHY